MAGLFRKRYAAANTIAAKTIQEIWLNYTDGINYCQVIEYIAHART